MTILWYDWPAPAPPESLDGILTIGNFDGVHRGHASLIDQTLHLARSLNCPTIAVTFDPHPLALLRPQTFMPVLTTITQRAELLLALGVDHVLILRTSTALLQLDAHTFFREIIQNRLRACGLVEGKDFCFGRNRSGNIDILTDLCRASDLRLVVAPPLLEDGIPISSSRVRNALTAGTVTEAARLLGRLYRLQGVVQEGQKRGRTIGVPTANLGAVQSVLPAEGVYAVRVQHRGTTWPGAANIGPNPTFGEHARKIEVHLIGYTGDLYGQTLSVDFVDRIRATRPFASVTELKAQLQQDIERARTLADPARSNPS